jgi:hypothetical protein
MTDSPERQYKPGDVANGHVLGADNVWRPVDATSDPTPASQKGGFVGWVGRHKILTGIAAIVLLALVISPFIGTGGEGEGSGSTAVAATTTPSSSTPSVTPTEAATTEEATTEPEPAGAQDLAIAEKAYGRDGDTYWYAVILNNPNKDYVFDSASIDVEAVAKDGTILDSDSNYTVLLSGKTAITGMFFDIGSEKIDHLEVRGPTASSATYSALSDTGSFTIGGVKTTKDDYVTKVSGTLTSTFSDEQESVKVVVLGRKGGKIVAADTTYVDRIPSGGKARFEVSVFEAPSGLKWSAYYNL